MLVKLLLGGLNATEWNPRTKGAFGVLTDAAAAVAAAAGGLAQALSSNAIAAFPKALLTTVATGVASADA